MKKENDIERDERERSFEGSGGPKLGGGAKITHIIEFYKKNLGLLLLALFLIGFDSTVGFYIPQLWSCIINILVGVCALFFIPYWKIKIIEKILRD